MYDFSTSLLDCPDCLKMNQLKFLDNFMQIITSGGNFCGFSLIMR